MLLLLWDGWRERKRAAFRWWCKWAPGARCHGEGVSSRQDSVVS